MKYLIDTHTALWLFNGAENLSSKARNIIVRKENELFISIVSAWEIAIKASINKLPEFDGVDLFFSAIAQYPIEIIGITPKMVKLVEKLPFIHKDPFDRILIATAKTENMTIITADEDIHKYDVNWVW